ncbi:cystathionine beta-lyase [Tilletia horrida]|uniref:Cystathionine beta-lyase n=1 Tax=Tilletia horrida TaxID=155126 RepID=A0AAN6JKA9_9BASI|nr:cystathionine beta-lyase [Tilletia horrida]KAK0531545.1 cystathionine beta-lyase [Tilletia horrida]KAK0558310.1 cystathionine beta-lyase [Tilletia horrida]
MSSQTLSRRGPTAADVTEPPSPTLSSATYANAEHFLAVWNATSTNAIAERRAPNSGFRFSTTCATVEDPSHKDQYGSSSAPIYMSATFKGPPGSEFDYSRSGNPTRSMLQHHLCQLQNCKYSFAVSSGMACLDVITRLLRTGDRIIAGDDLYGGTNRLLTYLAANSNIVTDHVDTTDAGKVEALLEQRAKDAKVGTHGPVRMVLLETPTNPLLKICDLERCARAAKKYAPEAIVVVDNTMMSPYLMRPLELGVDIVYDSGTKYLSGHHDLMAGVIACDREDLGQKVAFTINSVGNALTPMDSFLLMRGIKTLAVRMDRQQATTMLVAAYLDSLGFKVNYPGLPSHPSKDIHDRQAAGPGAVLSFETGDKALSERIVGGTRLWGISVSFGCVNSLISMPCLMSHASIDPKVRAARKLPEDLIRLCVGIEDFRDLIEDLENALLQAGAIQRRKDVDLVASGQEDEDEDGHLATARKLISYERVPLPGEEGGEGSVPALIGGLDTSKVETRGGDDPVGGADAFLSPPPPHTLTVSAPGKVILFGEHAVVHGVTAIAGAVGLRCYASISPLQPTLGSSGPRSVSLSLPDLGVKHVWAVDSLPWGKIPAKIPSRLKDGSSAGGVEVPTSLDEELKKAIETCVETVVNESETSHAASVAFLYLYLLIAKREARYAGVSMVVRSALPIGAGLGSSAAVSTCIASALLYTQGVLPALDSKQSEVPTAHAEVINAYAFLAEKVIHGNPSGVDNSVATFGGALAFTRAHEYNELTANKMEVLRGFSKVRFLITDTRVGRDTKTLVANVGRQKAEEPERVMNRLNAIQKISESATSALKASAASQAPVSVVSSASGEEVATLSRAELLKNLEELMDENHVHLVDLQVSHPRLEEIRTTTKQRPGSRRPLATKLTGAGGGGCAVTLIPDDVDDAEVAELIADLQARGFVCYETSVGGPGVGVLVESGSQAAAAAGTSGKVDDRTRLEIVPAAELTKWATELEGKWAFA